MSDEGQRERAISPAASFLVRAPAGSGKTALLTQRVLRLLATVDEPEQILAITFTRKAAAEMRLRVLNQLRGALGPPPASKFERQVWELGRRALARDAARGWRILESPRRLRIQTIDFFEASLVHRLPWLARWGASVAVTDNPQPIYADAVRAALRRMAAQAGQNAEQMRALVCLLNLRDNKLEDLTPMLVELAERRDEWLATFGAAVVRAETTGNGDAGLLRERLENNMRRIVQSRLAAIRAMAPDALDAEVAPLARRAAQNLEHANHPLEALASFRRWPEPVAEALPVWRGLKELFLTKAGTFRSNRGLDKRCGFPPDDRANKQQMAALLDRIRDNAEWEHALHSIADLPDPVYSATQWETMAALFRFLRGMLPELYLRFADRGATDFTEVALRAADALEEAPGFPSVLAERLDAEIRHLLVDEFQDTSVLQMRILRKLTENWEVGDGRTLFLVGDPMQSIYGWRNARVDLFLRTWAALLPGLPPLEALQLSRNFRSHSQLIAECNSVFGTLFPQQNDAATGAVRFSPADAGRADSAGDGPAIECRAFWATDERAEAAWIASEIASVRAAALSEGKPEPRVGILFRAGKNALWVAEALAAKGLRYQAIDLESLSALPVITDLRSLLHALLSASNRLAWWSILRAPWSGLRLEELERLHLLSDGASIWRAIERACDDARQQFSADSLRRLERMRWVYAEAFHWRGRRPLAVLLRAIYLAIGAAQCHIDARSQLAAEQFFRALLAADEAELMGDPSVFDQKLESLKAPPDPEAPESLQLLTVHKAKGLEFDVVFLPYLNAGRRNDSAKALIWEEVPVTDGTHAEDELLVIIPGDTRSQNAPSWNELLKKQRSARNEQERLRVLYVAMTRARERLRLSATIDPRNVKVAVDSTTGETTVHFDAKSGSYLKLLWNRFEPEFRQSWAQGNQQAPAFEEMAVPAEATYPIVRRLTLDSLPALPPEEDRPEELSAGETERFYRPGGAWETIDSAAGTVFHRMMELAATDGMLSRMAEAADLLRPVVLDALRRLLPAEPEIDIAAARVVNALRRTAASETGRSFFEAAHQQVFTEQSIACIEGAFQREVRLDRVFQDAEGHWRIVDFKLVDAQPADLDVFRREQLARYGEGMERYGRLWQQQVPGPVHLALYFPLQDLAVRWTLEPAVRTA